ncbi:Gfo/Idh/MocA family oxidoreductase [bacterium]|nr:Gfo/Idh/MocA family oxidoreductase [bacterium]
MSSKTNKTAIFGLGYFGYFHLKNIVALRCFDYGIDINPEKKKLVEKFGGKFFCADLTKAIEIKRDKNGNPISHKIEKNLPEIKELAKNTDVWDIATPSFFHFPLMLLGLELKKDIFVEKPSTERISETEYILKKFPKAKIGVDYIEMVHPVVLAIRDRMLKEKIQPFFFFHHRSKDLRGSKRKIGGGEGSRIILDDLVHDLSEIGFFRRNLGKGSLIEDPPKVKEAKIQTWKEIGYPYLTDVKAKFTLLFKDGARAEIGGSFADPEVRQFLIIDKTKQTAFYGNTLTREKIKPLAAKITGKRNIEYLKQKIKEMEITDNKIQEKVLKKINAEILRKEMQKYNPNQLFVMLKDFYQAKSKKDLICSLDQALEYQKIAEEVYKIAEKPKAIESKIFALDKK